MKKRIQSLTFLAILGIAVGMISWGSALHAQQTPSSGSQTQQAPPPTSPDSTPAQTPDNPPATQQKPSSQTPDSTAPRSQGSNSATPSGTDSQTFSGTVVKQGDKYVLKDDSGKTYDIDHQPEVAKFEGKRVRVQGTLDSSGSKILVK